MKKITIKVKNKELNALENYLVMEMTKKQKKKAKRLCLTLWGKLVKQYDK